MSDELDDLVERRLPSAGATLRKALLADPTPRLIGRLYAASDRGLRAKLLACLLRPLSPLGRAAVAAGVFAQFVTSDSFESILSAMDEATRFSVSMPPQVSPPGSPAPRCGTARQNLRPQTRRFPMSG